LKIRLRLLVLLAVPAALVLTGAGAANASPARPATVSSATVAANFAKAKAGAEAFLAAPHQLAAATTTNYIGNSIGVSLNGWSGGLGVMHNHDGSYTHGKYDAILPYQDWTDLNLGWTDHAAGFYIGPGFCAIADRSDNFGPWHPQGPGDGSYTVFGSGQWWVGLSTSYNVYPFSC
jgi:hypothetical protein